MFVAGSLAEAARRSVLTPLRPSPLIRTRGAAARGHSARGAELAEGWQEGLLGRHAREKRVRLGQPLNLGRHVLHAALFAFIWSLSLIHIRR